MENEDRKTTMKKTYDALMEVLSGLTALEQREFIYSITERILIQHENKAKEAEARFEKAKEELNIFKVVQMDVPKTMKEKKGAELSEPI